MQQHAGEFAALLAIYAERNPRRVLEIGAYEGGTLRQWLRSKVTPEIVVAVDSFDRTDRRIWLSTWPTWTRPGTRLHIIAGESQDPATVKAVERLAPFDFAFIDADHSYEAVSADWETYRPMCSGIVAFHDILPPSPQHPEIEVSRLWAQIKAGGYRTTEIVENPEAEWGGIGVVYLKGHDEALPSDRHPARTVPRSRPEGRGHR